MSNGNNNSNGIMTFSKKRYASVMVGLALIIGIMIFLKVETGDVQQLQFQNLTENVEKVDVKINNVGIKLNNTDIKVATGLSNQKVLAKGLNDLGSVALGEIRDIKDKTDLIDDIKFDTSRIINQSVGNVTFSQANKTNFTHINLTE